MVVLSLKDIAKSFGADPVLGGVSLTLTDTMRLGLVGQNGAGKTTLLRIVSGELPADRGEVSVRVPAGYLRQEVPAGTRQTVWETMLGVFDHAFALETRMRALEHGMESAAGDAAAWRRLSREYEAATQAFEDAGGYGFRSAISGVLHGLGLGEDVRDRAADTLSGGQRARLMLAKLLLERPQLLLLDEPTNHLDTDAACWLEGYLKDWQGAVVIVSHDRWFLDQTCTHIAALHGGKAELYVGNYTAFAAKRQQKRELAQKAYERSQREIGRQKKVIEQYRAWGRAGGGKNFIKARARETLLNKMERAARPESEGGRMSLRLGSATRSGREALLMEGVAMAFDMGAPLFTDLSLRLQKGDRAALVGPNGVGKTTLLRIVAQRLAPTAGVVVPGIGVTVGYYDQLQEGLCMSGSVLGELRESFPALSDGELRNALAAFLFYGDDALLPVSALSGGEKGRLSLLKLMLGGYNLLLLDEPTNHLDMDSREALEDALCAFDGTVLMVSHDRYFINKVATRVLELKAGVLTAADGNWSDYARALEQARAAQPAENGGQTKTAAAKQKRAGKQAEQLAREAKKRARQLETDIAQAEERLAGISARLADPAGLDAETLTALSHEYARVHAGIEAMMKEWETALGAL